MSDVTVLVVEDQRLLGELLAKNLEDAKAVSVIGFASNAEEAIELALEKRPAVLLMDIVMPGLSCFTAVERIREQLPAVRVLFLSAFTTDHFIEEALRVGALGYVTKHEPMEVLLQAIRDVAAGKAFFSERVLSRIVLDPSGIRVKDRKSTRLSRLSSRELEVLKYLAQGLAKKQIAKYLDISAKTVDAHAWRLMKKLAIHDRVELARYAIREGLVQA